MTNAADEWKMKRQPFLEKAKERLRKKREWLRQVGLILQKGTILDQRHYNDTISQRCTINDVDS